MRGALVGAAQEAEHLKAVDCRRLEVVARTALDLRLAELERIRSARADKAADSPASASA